MAEVAVVGAGLGGMASAARLAKLGHAVTVFEQREVAGGSLRSLEHEGFGWNTGATATGLPAVLRDLFRSTGRPLERYLDLRLLPARRHLFADGARLDLPTGSRAAQISALDAALGPGSGASWTGFVDAQADVWDLFRRSRPGPDWDGSPPQVPARRLPVRRSLHAALSRALPDERLRGLVGHRYLLAGSQLRHVPALAAVGAYVERSFGRWRCGSGLMQELADALVARLAERAVDVRYASRVTGIEVRAGRVSGIAVADGSRFGADLVVAAIDPLTVFGELLDHDASKAARIFRAAPRVEPPAVTHLGLRETVHGGAAGPGGDIVLHGSPLVEVSTAGAAPPGLTAWTVRYRAGTGEDVLAVMARRGVDVRADVVTRRDPRRAEPGSGGGPDMAWDGWRSHQLRAALDRPYPGLHVMAAALTPGASLPQVAWAAAHVADRIGRA